MWGTGLREGCRERSWGRCGGGGLCEVGGYERSSLRGARGGVERG